MRRHLFVIILILMMGLVMTACNGLESEPAVPTGLSSTGATSPEPPPTETLIVPTLTSTPEPSPTLVPTNTPTPTPFLPGNLTLLTYRTLGQVAELASIPLPDVIDLEFSPDGQYLRIRLPGAEETHRDLFYDLAIGEEIFRLEGRQRIYFNPDSTTIAALDGNNLTIYELPSGKEITQFNSRNQLEALSPDGRLIVEVDVVESGTTLYMVDLTTGEELYQIYINGKMEPESLHFDLDGNLMAVTYFVQPGTWVATIWNASTGRPVYTEYSYAEIALHPFGSEAAVSSARRSFISLVSTVTWEQRHYLGSAEQDPGYYDVAYASSGRLIYALSDRETTQAFFWYPPSGERIDLDLGLDVTALTISPDRRLMATADKSGLVTIWGVVE